MSSSDQQYPYPYDPERQQQPAQPHWPDGTAGQSAVPQEPAAFDQGATQTWQAPTWDTQYQPTIRPDGEPHRAQGQGYGQPQQPDPYGTPQPDPYGQHQQPGPYGTPEPHPPYQQQYQEPQHQPQYQEPQQPYRPPAADTAYLPPQGASGSFPLPPEVPAAPVAPVAPATPVSAAGPVTARPEAGDTGYSAPTTLGNARITDAQRARAEGVARRSSRRGCSLPRSPPCSACCSRGARRSGPTPCSSRWCSSRR
ncbi:hypothetical protein GCM10010342_52130 [Streptomyces anulatus]|nr:hypothetical protein GCM10010342_52130 [Streptomyces anulatus]